MTQPTPAAPPTACERLTTLQAFSRFADRVIQQAPRWHDHFRVPKAERDDVLQDTLIQAYHRRDSYEPDRGPDIHWAYGFFGRVARNHRKVKARRERWIEIAVAALPDVASEGPSPEEEVNRVMSRRLLYRCLATLDADSAAIVLAVADGIPMAAIAEAHDVSERTVHRLHQQARADLQRAVAEDRRAKRAHGVAVLPISLDQLLASERETGEVSEATARRMWDALDRVMMPDRAAGRLGDDGTKVERYMGRPDAGPRRRGVLLRLVRPLLDPRVSHSLTAVAGAAGGALVMYAIMAGPGRRAPDPVAEDRSRDAVVSGFVLPAAPPESVQGTPAQTAAELHADAGAPELAGAAVSGVRAPAGPGTRENIAKEQALFNLGATLYQQGQYSRAIDTFRAHASEYPQGRYAHARERMWVLALISAGRRAEARRRIEQLRSSSPDSPLLGEFDQAMNKSNRR